jgi:phosphonate transport system permease protein
MTPLQTEFNLVLAHQRRVWNRSLVHILLLMAIVSGCWYYVGLFDAERLGEGIPSLMQMVVEMFPPNFSQAKTWIKPLLDTLAMSVAGTAIAVLLSIPLGVLAARNTSPHPIAYHAARAVLNCLRSIPELIMGIVFVAAVGFGALPGVLALGLHSIGMIAKFFAESIEHADQAPIEAARAAGCSPLQVIIHGIVPQVLPQMADISIYRWEYNFRASTVMGMVGAGGIGFELMGSLRIMQYQDVSAILIIILAMVTLVDAMSSSLRRKFK